MNKEIELRYGRHQISVSYPKGTVVLSGREPQRQATRHHFAQKLDEHLAQRSLTNRRVAVVVADKTRLCDYRRYLPILVDRLKARGMKPADLTFYIAYGTHPPQTDRESRAAYGEVFSQYRFVHHDCMDTALFRDLGVTSRGTPVRLRSDIIAADYLITFGAISHHYFAGYGGGRKLVFPGLGQRDAIYHNHGLFLDPASRRLSVGCRSGNLQGNPLAEDLAEIERHRPADLAIHGILDSHGRVCQLLVGAAPGSFLSACRLHGGHYEVTGIRPHDLVIASCGGYPKDINFIQAHKAVHHAAAFVNDGGSLIVLARCRDGIGSETFLPWFERGGWEAAFDQLCRAYQGNGGTALAMMAKTQRIQIYMVTGLTRQICDTIGVRKIDAQTAIDQVNRHNGSLAVIPNASLLVKR